MNNKDKILIEIASYRDPELLNTINSAMIQADNKDRIYFAICLQSNDKEVLKKLKQMNNVRLSYMKEEDARGSCYARYLCQKLIEDEKYIYQIDSHMRFTKHWDTLMIKELESLNDPKTSISFYPPHCTEEMLKLPLDDPKFDNPAPGGTMHAYYFSKDEKHFIRCGCNTNRDSLDKEPVLKKNPLISAGNFFSYASIHKEVMHDPNMYFYGDEMPMAIRYYTYGWNNYCSTHSYIYHQYEKKDQKWPERPAKYKSEDKRFEELLNLDGKNFDMQEFGLGKVRTLKDFEEYSGINFKERTISMATEIGDFENQELKKKKSLIKDRVQKIEREINKQELIEVIIIDPFNNYRDCIKTILNKAVNKDNIKILLATNSKVSKKEQLELQIKKVIKINKEYSYCKVLNELTSYLDNSYVLITDSSVVFLDKWDEYNLKELKKCGKNSALTSWVWNKGEIDESITSYYNIIKDFNGFTNYMPNLKYNESIKLDSRKNPYKCPWISDGLLFTHSEVLKRVEVDQNLTYKEHQYIYSLRLWTNGIDIYYPTTSFFYRTRSDEELNQGEPHYGIISALAGLNNYYSRRIESGYTYDIGTNRPLSSWYDEIGFDYTKDKDYEIE